MVIRRQTLTLRLQKTTPDSARAILNGQPQIACALMAVMVNVNAVNVEVVQVCKGVLKVIISLILSREENNLGCAHGPWCTRTLSTTDCPCTSGRASSSNGSSTGLSVWADSSSTADYAASTANYAASVGHPTAPAEYGTATSGRHPSFHAQHDTAIPSWRHANYAQSRCKPHTSATTATAASAMGLPGTTSSGPAATASTTLRRAASHAASAIYATPAATRTRDDTGSAGNTLDHIRRTKGISESSVFAFAPLNSDPRWPRGL